MIMLYRTETLQVVTAIQLAAALTQRPVDSTIYQLDANRLGGLSAPGSR